MLSKQLIYKYFQILHDKVYDTSISTITFSVFRDKRYIECKISPEICTLFMYSFYIVQSIIIHDSYLQFIPSFMSFIVHTPPFFKTIPPDPSVMNPL